MSFQQRLKVFVMAAWLALAGGSVVAEPRPLSISVGDWPPFFAQELRYQGVVAHLIRDVFAAEGYEVTFHFLPWNRAYREAALGARDATAVWMHQADREADFFYSEPVLEERFVFFYRRNDGFHWQTMDDLVGKRFGGGFSYSYGPEFDTALEQELFTMERVPTTAQNFLRLLVGHIDAFPEEQRVGYHILRRELTPDQAAEISHHPLPLLSNKSFVLFPRSNVGSEALMARFNERLQVFRDSGRYQSYFDAFEQGFYQPDGEPVARSWVPHVATGLPYP
ncbi:MAG: transporter substrate-binding domain-containing protein [Marinobacter sp.]|nr:transporter substrate-binding domain-containing protein [Marinobacter sp.]